MFTDQPCYVYPFIRFIFSVFKPMVSFQSATRANGFNSGLACPMHENNISSSRPNLNSLLNFEFFDEKRSAEWMPQYIKKNSGRSFFLSKAATTKMSHRSHPHRGKTCRHLVPTADVAYKPWRQFTNLCCACKYKGITRDANCKTYVSIGKK